jgi:hypothetical protein
MFNRSQKILSIAVAVLALAGFADAASAETTFQKDHPRRAQVNSRLAKQNERINQDVKNGSLTKRQAAGLHRQDHQVRQEERDMAAQNGGHISRPEQNVLNSQENVISGRIPKN